MQVKKNPQSDIYQLSGVFLLIGLIISLGSVFMAFEWKFNSTLETNAQRPEAQKFEEQIEIPITQLPPPPPPVMQQPEIKEVPDEQEVEQQLADLDFETNEKEVVKTTTPVVKKKPEKKPEKKVEEDFDQVFDIVEQQPEPEGGMEAFYKYIAKELEYPSVARRMGVEGKVYVQFVVDKDGKLTEVEVVKGISKECDEEAIRVIESINDPKNSKAPKWKAGMQRGRPVKVKMVIPIVFRLK